MKPEILYEDKEIIVCIKPAGIPTQSSRIGTPDMVSILKNYLSASSSAKQPPYLAVIHRLDQPVEGILVFAKTPAAAKKLNQQLQTSGFGKHYLALLSAVPSVPESNLLDYMIKDGRTNTSRICTPDTPGAKAARLHYRVTGQSGSFAIAEITLDTGRHHQIRVQMSHLGCPIIGDRKYGSPNNPVDTTANGLFNTPVSQLQLFAYRLTFRHPASGNVMEFSIEDVITFKKDRHAR